MKNAHLLHLMVTTLALSSAAAAQQGESIVQTRHNLTANGPGPYRAQSEGDVCIFCHAPHKSRLQTPLWNRDDSVTSYLTYTSTTFQGSIAQPNGTTKLCLSCHDGTIALGRVVSSSTEIPMLTGRQYLNAGAAFLGASLRDDHPVSFPYATSRGGSGVGYLPASSIKPPVHLDENGEMQCTSCHDPHKNTFGSFLHVGNQRSALCLSCHSPVRWAASAHANSARSWNGNGQTPWPTAHYDTVADNGCVNCHREHGAGQPQRLLNFNLEEDNCLRCHNGNVASKSVATDVTKASAHSPAATLGIHDPTEDPGTMPRHAECQDCHNPHQATAGTAPAPGVPGPLTGVGGISSGGTRIDPISNGYELCYKCHADNHGGTVYVPRQLVQANVRFEFNLSNPSYHPIEGPGRNSSVPSLLPPWTTSSRVACTDCHDSNTSPSVGGTGARGPHGSNYRPILALNYTTTDNTSESSAAYALCYKCHSRTSILGNASFREHNKHIVGERSPCSVCHDSHGINAGQGNATNNSNLINFDTSVVRPYNGVIRFTDLGTRRGNCTLICHGETHNNLGY